MVRDRKAAFIGSQSLHRPQIDGRREIGDHRAEAKIAKAIADVFDRTGKTPARSWPKEKAKEWPKRWRSTSG